MQGSRAGMMIAGTWATLNWLGQNGYTKNARAVIGTTRWLRDQLAENYKNDVTLVGNTGELCIVAFKPINASPFGV